MKARSPVLGYNHNVRYAGRLWHVQTEDSGVHNPHVFTHLFHDGTILATKRLDYDAASEVGVVQKLMQAQHKSMLRDLKQGAFDDKIGKFFGAPVVRDAEQEERTDPNAGRPSQTIWEAAIEVADSELPPPHVGTEPRLPAPNPAAPRPSITLPRAAPTGTFSRPLIGTPARAPASAPPAAASRPLQPPAASAAPPLQPPPAPVRQAPPPAPTSAAGSRPGITAPVHAGAMPPTPPGPTPPAPPPAQSTRTQTRPVLSPAPPARSVSGSRTGGTSTNMPRPSVAGIGGRRAAGPPVPNKPTAEGVVIARPAVIVGGAAADPHNAERSSSPTNPQLPRAAGQTHGGTGVGGTGSRWLPNPAPAPPPAPQKSSSSDNIFGGDLISEKSLDEVILAYLSEDLNEK